MDTKLKEVLEAKDCPMIYAARDKGIEIACKGKVEEILALISTFMLSVSIESEIPLEGLLSDLITSTAEALKELEEEHEEIRKAGMN